MFKIGFLIYTFNRVDDAKINQEIIRNIWQKNFLDIKIVHSYNGDPSWYPQKYLEDELVTISNPGHFQGASELIDAGMTVFQEKFSDLDYIIILAADTWLIKPDYVENILNEMKANKKYIATCPWGTQHINDFRRTGIATDFWIIDLKWVIKFDMFPLDYQQFQDQYGDFLLYQYGAHPSLEKLAFARFMKAVVREDATNLVFETNTLERIFRMSDREPIHSETNEGGNYTLYNRHHYWPQMGLVTHHEPEPKRDILKEYNITGGENINKLLTSTSLDYYNTH